MFGGATPNIVSKAERERDVIMSTAARQAGRKIAQGAGQAAASADARGGNALRKGARRDPELYVSRPSVDRHRGSSSSGGIVS